MGTLIFKPKAKLSWPFGALQPKRYGLILADPPWAFKAWGEHDHKKSADGHYQVLTMDDLFALPVHLLAAPDCVLVLWGVQAMVPQALALLQSWGFEFKTSGSWAKQSKTGKKWAFGTGYVLRSASEPYFIGVRGKPKTTSKSIRNLIVAPVREHSRKPDQMHADLEALYPGVHKAELFARQSRPGWDTWGNQATKFDMQLIA